MTERWSIVLVISAGLLLPAAPTSASEITVEWNGNFLVPDIIDPPGVFIELTVSPDPGGMDLITDLDVHLMIPTTWQGNLIIALEHVDSGRSHTLLDQPGSPVPNHFGFSADNYGNQATGERFVLDDEAMTPYDVPFVEYPGIPDVTGRWQPDAEPLSSFDGDVIGGTWRMWFADQGGGDQAFVQHIGLHFTTVPGPATCVLVTAWLCARVSSPRGRRRRSRR